MDLDRFVDAQRDVHATALAELRAGRKRTHWMWFVLPQLRGLGTSAMATRYGIADADEALAYLAHPVLGPRLAACARALLDQQGLSARDILGTPDDVKLRSSMTLFQSVSPPGSLFQQVLDRFFGGEPDPRTVEMLATDASTNTDSPV